MPKTRKMLSDWNAPYIQSLLKLIETQSKATLIIWAVDYAERVILPLWSKYYPGDLRPQNALNVAREWLKGAIKLPRAKVAILDCHAAAREAAANPVAQAAARAIGQSASTIHSARHCIGLALYGALAVAYDRLGTKAPWEKLEQYAAEECLRMLEALRSIAVENEPNPAKIDWKMKMPRSLDEPQMSEKKKCSCCSDDAVTTEAKNNGEYVCYCNKVTEQDIVKAINEKGANSVDEVIKMTGAMVNSNCKVNNPKGTCCYPDIIEVFNRYMR